MEAAPKAKLREVLAAGSGPRGDDESVSTTHLSYCCCTMKQHQNLTSPRTVHVFLPISFNLDITLFESIDIRSHKS